MPNAEYYAANRDRILELQRASKALPANKRRRRAKALFKLYGVTEEDYLQLVLQQDGLCAICHEAPGQRGFHVDHDHMTGAVRGLLCHGCNTGLGLFQDNPHILARAAHYLRETSWT